MSWTDGGKRSTLIGGSCSVAMGMRTGAAGECGRRNAVGGVCMVE